MPALIGRPGLESTVRWDHELDALELPRAELDAVLMILFYHDTFWQDVDRAKMNAGILAALRPGGTFAVIDHHAEVGSAARDAQTLHRGDAEQIKAEILAAGFEWVSESDLLRHPEDDRTRNVFEEGMRGKTDRFVHRFRKPEAPAPQEPASTR